jgi:hypothetical protein
MKLKRSQSPLTKKARRGFRGYPVATIAFYGPDARRATKVAVGIVRSEGGEPDPLERWFAEEGDIRKDPTVLEEVLELVQREGVRSVVMTDRIIGCPHEEGIDYPEGQVCPLCPFWANRDRWTGDVLR